MLQPIGLDGSVGEVRGIYASPPESTGKWTLERVETQETLPAVPDGCALERSEAEKSPLEAPERYSNRTAATHEIIFEGKVRLRTGAMIHFPQSRACAVIISSQSLISRVQITLSIYFIETISNSIRIDHHSSLRLSNAHCIDLLNHASKLSH